MFNKKMNENKRGISPVIATVLLIAMVVVSGLIVFLWFNGIVQEEGTKFEKNIKLNCADVRFDASYEGTLSVLNSGNVPIYRMNAKIFKEGGYDTIEISNWPEKGLNPGAIFSGNVDTTNANKILLIPVLIGSSGEGRKTYTCEDQYGYEIVI